MIVSIVVEGISDAAVLRRLCSGAGLRVGTEHVTGGKAKLDQRLGGYNNAARFAPWIVLRDLDHDAPCASALLEALLPQRAEGMHVRVPIRSVESWLLADQGGFAKFFGVAAKLVPHAPDSLDRPKRTVVDLARRSTRRTVREGVAPAAGTSAQVGPEYTAHVIEFSMKSWDPDRAAANSDSLRRCLAALRRLSELAI